MRVSCAISLSFVRVSFVQADRLRDPPLLCPQHDGPRGSAHSFVSCGLLHYGWHRRSNLPGTLPRGGVDGSAWRAAHLYDHNSTGIPATAGFTQLWVFPQKNIQADTPCKKKCVRSSYFLLIPWNYWWKKLFVKRTNSFKQHTKQTKMIEFNIFKMLGRSCKCC